MWNKALRLVTAIGVFGLSGCVTASLTCPNDGMVTATSNAPSIVDIAGQLASIIASSGIAGGAKPPLGAPKAAAPASSVGTVSWKAFTLLGQQSVSCGRMTPVPPTGN